ncbi:uncharacterized protein LOC125671936 isoform X1 [Ostrea edulis]|uniref:uncharacterized protein LOC125671936 isoform X1 n=1 Tax=Ostrea edulis TaxID=37623 RepID=UPI0024AFF25C|nr:uncharacterized protein LOC125671936 isoform X1 [Ostrea edulis]
MAAPVKYCVLCQKTITDRSYRSLSSATSQEQYKDVYKLMCVPSIKGFACNSCANKLNRVQKLNNDLKTKLISIKDERDKLLSTLKDMTGVRSLKDKLSTPKGTKRVLSSLKLTPTPKSKVKKGLFLSPSSSSKRRVEPVKCHDDKKIDECTQTKDQSEEFDVKIVVKYSGVERLKIIKEEHEQAALKSLLNNASPRAVLKNLSLNENYKKEMFDIVKNVILNEIKHISKKDSEIFKGHASNNEKLIKFDWKCTSQQLQLKAPYLYSVFSSVVGLQKKKNLPQMLTSLAVLLYGRSQTINQLQYILGLILQKCGLNREGMNIIHDLGITISPTSLHKKTKELVKQQENRLHSMMTSYVEEIESRHEMGNETAAEEQMDAEEVTCNKKLRPIEILGDNLDITITPSKMSLQNQKKSLHWFLVLVKEKQITFDESKVPFDPPVDFPTLNAVNWIPSSEQLNSLMSNFKFHVANVLMHYVPFLQLHITNFPKYIEHMYMDQMRKKSVFLNCDLVDASENSSQGMIEILQRVHQLAVPHVRENPEKNVLEKVVFGGDALTNERAFSAQEAMQNSPSEYESLLGVIHRPEGLHREMNFLLV